VSTKPATAHKDRLPAWDGDGFAIPKSSRVDGYNATGEDTQTFILLKTSYGLGL